MHTIIDDARWSPSTDSFAVGSAGPIGELFCMALTTHLIAVIKFDDPSIKRFKGIYVGIIMAACTGHYVFGRMQQSDIPVRILDLWRRTALETCQALSMTARTGKLYNLACSLHDIERLVV